MEVWLDMVVVLFSEKDPSKVDRSAAYAARYVAKNIIASKLADCCEIQVSYAIGVAEPTSITIDTFGTNNIDENEIISLISKNFDFRPKGLIDFLELKKAYLSKNCCLWTFW